MNAYLGEMCYRFDRRNMHVSMRVDDLLGRTEGRLKYRILTNAEATA
jgi:hypothetical protein